MSKRTLLAALLSLVAPGCGLKKMLPEAPALDAWERSRDFPGETPSGVSYTGDPRVSFPVLPVQVFGAVYDLDLVIVSTHPEWNMHEYAMLRTPTGPLWIAKDARQSTMSQSIVADLPDIDAWMPEIPLPRKSSPVEVEDRSTEDALDVVLRYENIDGQPVVATYQGKPPGTLQKKRNGSAMGHSRDLVLAVLDLSHRDFGKKASIEIGGEKWPIKRLLGLLPFRMALKQAQGGLAIGDIRLAPGGAWAAEPIERESLGSFPDEAVDAGGAAPVEVGSTLFTATYAMADDSEVRTRWEIEEGDTWIDARQVSDLRTIHYRFRKQGPSWELWWAEVTQWGQPAPVTHFEVQPCLPDLRRPFEGRWQGRFVIDVNGQQSHAVGRIEAWWEDRQAHVRVIPEAPWWTADRPMETTISYASGKAHVEIARIEPPEEP